MSKPEKVEELQKLVVSTFFTFYLQMKTFHFQTESYNRHANVDAFLKEYSELYDRFVEVCMGRHGTIEMGDYSLAIKSIDDDNVLEHVDTFLDFLDELRELYADYPDLLNIRDEMEAAVHVMVYKLNLD
jgi:DNA-binding ferritin-like protein